MATAAEVKEEKNMEREKDIEERVYLAETLGESTAEIVEAKVQTVTERSSAVPGGGESI